VSGFRDEVHRMTSGRTGELLARDTTPVRSLTFLRQRIHSMIGYLYGPCLVKGESVYPHIVARYQLLKDVPAATKNVGGVIFCATPVVLNF
jgi:hypothetical protein